MTPGLQLPRSDTVRSLAEPYAQENPASARSCCFLLPLGWPLPVGEGGLHREDAVRDGARRSIVEGAPGQPVKVASIAATIYPSSDGESRPRHHRRAGQDSSPDAARRHRCPGAAVAPHRTRSARAVGRPCRTAAPRLLDRQRLDDVRLPSAPSAPPVEIVSIDEIVLRGVEIVSGGRTLTGDVEVIPEGNALTLRRVSLLADNARIEVTGRIADLSGPVGSVAIKAGALNFDRLLAFADAFASGAGMRPAAAPKPRRRALTGNRAPERPAPRP